MQERNKNMAIKTDNYIVKIDTREQAAWNFPADVQTEPGTLQAGDYTLKGLEELITIERKELGDLVSCVTGERDRFKRELLRLRSYRCKCVIVEAALSDVIEHRYRALTTPESIIGSVASWQSRYDVSFVWAGDRAGAARYALATFRTFYNQFREYIKQFKLED